MVILVFFYKITIKVNINFYNAYLNTVIEVSHIYDLR